MGEIAEMMLDGTLCEGCGEYLGDGGYGVPRYCSPQCAQDRGTAPKTRGNPETQWKRLGRHRIEYQPQVKNNKPQQAHKPWLCSGCKKRFHSSEAGLQHLQAKCGMDLET